MDEETRNLDLMVGELESENKLIRERNEQLQQELERVLDENAQFKITLERIMAITKLAYVRQETELTKEEHERF